MRAVEWAEDPKGTVDMSGGDHHDLLTALTGLDAGRERALAVRTRRVVGSSLGVLRDQQAGRSRGRSVALAFLLVLFFTLTPFFWRLADDLIDGENLADLATQLSLLLGVLCPALVAAVLVVGWVRHRS